MKTSHFNNKIFTAAVLSAALTIMSSACSAKNQTATETAVETGTASAEVITTAPQITAQPISTSAPSSVSVTPAATPKPTPQPTPTPAPTPPAETRQMVESLISFWKDGQFNEIQPLLTDRYDFEGDPFINSVNFNTYAAKSEFTITGETFLGDKSEIYIQAVQPDIGQFINDFVDLMTDESDGYDGDEDDYIKAALEKDDSSVSEMDYTITLAKGADGWKIELDSPLVRFLSPNGSDPFAFADWSYGEAKSRDESLAYMASSMALTEEDGYIVLVNNGNKEVISASLKLEYVDDNGVLKRTAYDIVFYSMQDAMMNDYQMKPGYMWANTKNDLFWDSDDYGASLEKCRVSLFDVQYINNMPWPELSTAAKQFCDEYISIESYDIAQSSTAYGYVEGVTELAISNNSDETVTKLTLLVEFADAEGTIRSGKTFRIVDESYSGEDDSVDATIEPHSEWSLASNQLFPLFSVPEKLIQENSVTLRVVELVTEKR